MPGYEIERVRFHRWLPLAEGFAAAAKYIQAAGRPLTSFCACELRSPAAFTDEGFRKFNEHYVKTLGEWGIYDGKTNPVARSNVCPEIDPPAEPSFYAFSFTRPSTNATPSFVIAGSGEAQEGGATYAERTVRYRDISPDGIEGEGPATWSARWKAAWARSAIGWKDATAAQIYTVHDFHPVLADELVQPRRRARRADLAFRAAAGDRSRIRDGLPQGDAGDGDLAG